MSQRKTCGCSWLAELVKWFAEHPEALEALMKQDLKDLKDLKKK